MWCTIVKDGERESRESMLSARLDDNDDDSDDIYIYIYIYHHVVVMQWLSKLMDTMNCVQILDEPIYISHSTDTLGKGMNPIIFPPAMDKL